MTISLTMVLPGLLGYWVDTKLGTRAVFTIGGFLAGMAYGMWQLMLIAQAGKNSGHRNTRDGT